MLTLFHAPQSRSTRIVQLVHELGPEAEAQVEIRRVSIVRFDGSGRADAANPHPEGKVPLLVQDGTAIWESTAIALHLTDLFPASGLGAPTGTPQRGRLMSWLAWYGDVVEPVVHFEMGGIRHPSLTRSFRGMAEVGDRLGRALADAPYLMGERFSVADLILASTFGWQASLTPDIPEVRDWVARCNARPAAQRAWREDAAASAA